MGEQFKTSSQSNLVVGHDGISEKWRERVEGEQKRKRVVRTPQQCFFSRARNASATFLAAFALRSHCCFTAFCLRPQAKTISILPHAAYTSSRKEKMYVVRPAHRVHNIQDYMLLRSFGYLSSRRLLVRRAVPIILKSWDE